MPRHDGAAIRFTEDGARSMGRTGHGVRVIKLREGDYVVGAGVCRPGANVLTISEEGKGRRSRIDDYRITKRGGLGIRNYSNGNVAGIKIVDDADDLILISQNGILIRIHAADINVQSRYGSGVRVMRLVEDDKVAVVARVDRDNDAETAKIEDTGEERPDPGRSWQQSKPRSWSRRPRRTQPENDTEESNQYRGEATGRPLLFKGFPPGAATSSKGFPWGGCPQAADEGEVR